MKHWIEAARVRTLPLSVSGILIGCFYAMSQSTFNWNIVFFALTTTLLLQILSNFANDYGDGVKGTDNADRIGPTRAVQSGVISPAQMKRAMVVTSVLTMISAVALIYFSFKEKYLLYSLAFLFLGFLAVASAIRYTVGNTAYGYRGYGDLFVLVFFGYVSTLGIYFMFMKEIDPKLILPATAVGFLSVGVLNLNNMRDEESDRKSGKNTIVVKIGGAAAKKYHFFLVVSAMLMVVIFSILDGFTAGQYIYLIAFLPMLAHLGRVAKNKEPRKLDPELKKLAISTFLMSVLLSLSFIYFLQDIFVQIYVALTNPH
ncbi:1,4-dihydroxy-2-naphthoate octaprenyltransferase [Flavobacterium sp. MAH-1]|uniref:1,4-dihydroxy-2-naphthoate octaprenyltransferase n=1 Tax=Flavobacterium agri TaxID=2743471 RepID=A0A7Y8XZQ4_9FLAO|nr:1,4-dihydroxy-2-naphthoate octaprenyltransferase [Flavobacterium agri]NUY79808.1 1,4-dihydroxy-2-naphthoate octaprenyltransferase [Flavobacterium agri]NYA69833.1 1,4-dihydroxy-2-naphthoate octaprenyltransferase [Flavobacterium agri]